MADTESKGVWVEGRMVPFPKSVSREAQSFLAGTVGPDGLPPIPARSYPPAGDLAAHVAVDRADRMLEHFVVDVREPDVITGKRADMGDAAAHLSGADDADRLDRNE